MKVLAISHGMDVVTYSTLAQLAKDAGYDVTIAGPADVAERVEAPCRWAEMPPVKSKFSPKAIGSLRSIIGSATPDVIYAVSTSALSTAIITSLGRKVKIVGYRGTQAHVHRFDPTYRMALLNPRVDHIICETPDIMEYLRGYVRPQRLSWHAKPFEPEWLGDALSNPSANREAPADSLKLIFIGHSKGRPHKGLGVLLTAMDTLKDDNVHLTVVGEASQADMARLRPNVTFMGHRPDAVNFLPTHDVLVLPSIRDASPRVLREAQACGVPCIVSDIPGARDLIVDNRSGVLVEPDHPQAIVTAVRSFLYDPKRIAAMGEEGKANIARNYKMGDYVEYLKRTFTQVLTAPRD